MEKTKNVWLQMNSQRINSLMKQMEEERFKSAYQGQVNFAFIISLMKGMIQEIENLQKIVDASKVTT